MDLDILALPSVIKNLGNLWQFAVGFMEISLLIIFINYSFLKKSVHKNKFLALVKKVLISAFFNFSENCLTLPGCGVQTT